MKNTKTICVSLLLFLLALLLGPPAHAQISTSWPTPVFSCGGGAQFGESNTLSGTVTFPLTNAFISLTNSSVTNTTTNIHSGIVDITKEAGFCVQEIFNTTSATNMNTTVIYQWVPSLDGTNFDTANTTFYDTNVCNGTTQVSHTFHPSSTTCQMFGAMKLNAIVISGTAILTSNIVQASPKRAYAPY